MTDTLYGVHVEEIKHRRDLLLETIRNYSIKHYDARMLLPEYHKLTDWLNARGYKFKPVKYCTEQYWSNPLKYDKQSQNKNPVVEVKDGRAIRQFQTVAPKIAKTKVVAETTKATPKTTTKSPKETKSSYYKIIISWTENADNQKPYLTKILKFFDELGLSQIEKDAWQVNPEISEHQITYKFEGTDDGFTMLKRSAMVLLDILNENNNFEVAIYGKKIT